MDAQIADEPVDALYPVLIDPIPEYMVAGGDETKSNSYLSHEQPLVGQMRAIERNKARIWFYGTLDYVDVFDQPHTPILFTKCNRA